MKTVDMWFKESIERYKKLAAETTELKENILTLPLEEILQRCESIKKLQASFIDRDEKLHEIMVPRDDAHNTLEYDDKYIIQPEFRFFGRRFNANSGKPVPDDFEYNSETNSWKLSIDEMKEIIRSI